MTMTAVEPLTMMKARLYVESARCHRCAGLLVIEQCYDHVSAIAESFHQFKCLACGWRDDIRHLARLQEREAQRQAVRMHALPIIEIEGPDAA